MSDFPKKKCQQQTNRMCDAMPKHFYFIKKRLISIQTRWNDALVSFSSIRHSLALRCLFVSLSQMRNWKGNNIIIIDVQLNRWKKEFSSPNCNEIIPNYHHEILAIGQIAHFKWTAVNSWNFTTSENICTTLGYHFGERICISCVFITLLWRMLVQLLEKFNARQIQKYLYKVHDIEWTVVVCILVITKYFPIWYLKEACLNRLALYKSDALFSVF